VPENEDRWRGITARVEEESPGSRRYHVHFRRVPVPGGAYPAVPDEARVIVQRVADGDLHVALYTPPECETPGESRTDWQALAVEAVEKHLAKSEGRVAVNDTLDLLGEHGDLGPGVSAGGFPLS
jgi:hypothetical protein